MVNTPQSKLNSGLPWMTAHLQASQAYKIQGPQQPQAHSYKSGKVHQQSKIKTPNTTLPGITNYITANSKVRVQQDPVLGFINSLNPSGGDSFISNILGSNPKITTGFTPKETQGPQLPKTTRNKDMIISNAKERYNARQTNKLAKTQSFTPSGSIVDNMNNQRIAYAKDPAAFAKSQQSTLKLTSAEKQSILTLYNQTGDPNLKAILTHAGNTPKQQAINESREKANTYLQSQQNPGSFMGKMITARDLFKY